MIDRHVTLVSTTDNAAAFARLREQTTRRLKGWHCIISSNFTATWVYSQSPDQPPGQNVVRNSCIIGTAFCRSATALPSSNSTLWGAYLQLFISTERREITIYRDPTGRIECWRMILDDADVLFSHYTDVEWMRTRPLTIDWNQVIYYLHNQWNFDERTGFVEIKEVLAGQTITYSDRNVRSALSWDPSAISSNPHPDLSAAKVALKTGASRNVIRV